MDHETLNWSHRFSSSQGKEIGYFVRWFVIQGLASMLMRPVSSVKPARRLRWPLYSSGVTCRHRHRCNHSTSSPHSCAPALMSSHYKNITKQRKDFWSAVAAMWRIEKASCESSPPSRMSERPNRLSPHVEQRCVLAPRASMAGMKLWRSTRCSPWPQFFLCVHLFPDSSLTNAEDTTGRCQRPPLWFPETWGQGRTGGDLQWQPWGRKWHIGLNLLPVRCELPFMTEGKCRSLSPSLFLHSSSLDRRTVSLCICGMTQTMECRCWKNLIFPLQVSVVAWRKVSGKVPVMEWSSCNTFQF